MNCTIIGDFINWEANNTPANAYQHLGLHESLFSTVLDPSTNKRLGQLRIRGSSKLNGTKITCIATKLGNLVSTEESEPVLILVEGILFIIYMQSFPAWRLVITCCYTIVYAYRYSR